ncbi:MAG: VOC family protein [Rubellimicrobium sp.]|nr:VOC family protein [Rubellimicrobium sp.]
MRLDHIAVTCADLDAGVARVEALLGAPLAPGGQHVRYATHNRLLGLGPDEYLEVIAPDPGACPSGPRWFALDHAAEPRLANWIVAVPDLDAALSAAPPGAGSPVALSRGDLAWRIAVPDDGSLPMGGGFPTLIEWRSRPHPATALPDHGIRLTALEIHHPEAADLAARLGSLADLRLRFHRAAAPGLRARLATPAGAIWLE